MIQNVRLLTYQKITTLISCVLAFNAIVRVCLKQLLPAIYRFLRIKVVSTTKLKPETSTNWKYLEHVLKKYLLNFTRVCYTFSQFGSNNFSD
jgi:hypothetical protein